MVLMCIGKRPSRDFAQRTRNVVQAAHFKF